MVLEFTLLHLTLGGKERFNKGHLVFIWLCIIHNVILDSGAIRPRSLLLWFDGGSNNLCSLANFVAII